MQTRTFHVRLSRRVTAHPINFSITIIFRLCLPTVITSPSPRMEQTMSSAFLPRVLIIRIFSLCDSVFTCLTPVFLRPRLSTHSRMRADNFPGLALSIRLDVFRLNIYFPLALFPTPACSSPED
ncbi:hypothetical protein GYMLUDRAFT_854016 [Collybiopsis luxurians FD-317 M1]|nr:hypothetical protein GYMLUDRAFT_854016 [Collybiopsis luxurians FD-317 M1]